MEANNYRGLLNFRKELNIKIKNLEESIEEYRGLPQQMNLVTELDQLKKQIEFVDFGMSCIVEEWNKSSLIPEGEAK